MNPKRTRCITRAGQGAFADLGHHRAFVKVGAQATGGACLVTEVEADPGGEVPSHVHACEDHIFYVIAGQFAFQVGRRTVVARPCDTVFARHGVVHGWRCLGSAPGCFLMVTTPGDQFEAFVNDLVQRPDPLDVGDDLVTLAAAYQVGVLPIPGRG